MNESEQAIDDALRRLMRKRRRVAAARVFIIGFSFAAAWLLAAALFDRWHAQRGTVRVFDLGVTACLVFGTVAQALRLITASNYIAVQAARLAEAADKAWGERLSTVVTQLRLPMTDRGSSAFIGAMRDEVARELVARPPVRRVKLSAARSALTLCGGVIAAWLAALIVPTLDLPRLVERQLMPWSDVVPVTNTQIDLLRHAAAIAQGQSLSIVADLNRDASAVTLNFGPDLQHLRPLRMERTYGFRYSVTLITPPADFVYRVTAGDAMSSPVVVKVVRTPGVTTMNVDLTYADGRPPRRVPDCDGNLRVPSGTRVAVTFRTTEPLRSATLRVGHAVIPATSSGDKRTWKATFVAKVSTPWAVGLVSDRGARGNGSSDMQIQVDPDPASRPAGVMLR